MAKACVWEEVYRPGEGGVPLEALSDSGIKGNVVLSGQALGRAIWRQCSLRCVKNIMNNIINKVMNGNEYLPWRCVLPSVITCICDDVEIGPVNFFTHTFFFCNSIFSKIRSRENTTFGELEEPDLEHSWTSLCFR